jgi:hypothetical protein
MSMIKRPALILSALAISALSFVGGRTSAPDAPPAEHTVEYVDAVTGETTQIDVIGITLEQCDQMGGYYIPNDGDRCESVDY